MKKLLYIALVSLVLMTTLNSCEKWLDYKYILKIELPGFADQVYGIRGKKSGFKDISKYSDPSNIENGVATY